MSADADTEPEAAADEDADATADAVVDRVATRAEAEESPRRVVLVVATAVEWPPAMHATNPAAAATLATPVTIRAPRAG